MHDQTLIYGGGEVKALGPGRVGGYVVRFGSEHDHDVQGDYFAPTTYFGRAVKAGLDVVYHHGLGRIDELANKLGNRPIGEATLTAREDGLWADATLLDGPDTKAVYALAEAGKLGWSSGSVERLVARTAVKSGVTRIDRWPLIEVSLSPRPVDPRNRAVAIKSLIDPLPDAGRLVDRAEALVSDAEALAASFRGHAQHRAAEGRSLSAAKREAIKALRDALGDLHDSTAPRPDAEELERLRRRLLAVRI